MKIVEVSISKLREVIQISVNLNKLVRPTYLIPDEEALVVAAADIEGDHGSPVETNMISSELQSTVA